MNLLDAREGEEYIVKNIVTDDEELEAFTNRDSNKLMRIYVGREPK